MIIRGKSLMLSVSLLILIAVSGYYLMNSYYTNLPLLVGEEEPYVPVGNPSPPGLLPEQQPDAFTDPSKDFFNEHRLERDKQRSMQLELLREIINNSNTADELRSQAQQAWLALTATMEKELTIEKLVIGKGYPDALLLLNGDVAHLLVKTAGLNQAQAIQITELVASSLQIDANNVRVIERE